jgi:polysaccharide pyruvyl transferase WcaK-like protein
VVSVAVVNQHTNNFGDDAAGVALVHEAVAALGASRVDVFYIWHQVPGEGLPVEVPGVEHHFLRDLSGATDMRPRLAIEVVARLLGRGVRRPDLRRLLDTCRAADVVYVSPAGSNIGIYKDWMYLFVLALLVLEGIRPEFMQNTIGSSGSRIFDSVARRVLRRSSLSVRELGSEQWLAKQGMSSYLGVDTALLDVHLTNGPASDERYLALVPTRLANWHRDFRGQDESLLWRDRLVEATAGWSVANRLPIRVVPHLYGSQAEAGTLEAIVDALAAAGADASLVGVASLDEYRSALAGARIVVSMRYHGLILSGQHGVPCIALSYERKMREAAAYLGMSDLCLDVRDFTKDELLERLERAHTGHDELRAQLLDAQEPLREIARGPVLATKARLLRRAR